MVVVMELYSQIRESYLSGESQRSIAHRLGVSRQTVKKYCEGKTMPGVRKEYTRIPSVITEDIEAFIRNCIALDAMEGLKKQTHTAKRIYDRLLTEKQFTGSYSVVRQVVHEMKEAIVPPQADILYFLRLQLSWVLQRSSASLIACAAIVWSTAQHTQL